jgi:hypothetical protein
VRLDEKSSAGFAVISWHDQLHLAWTGNDMRINLASAPDGREITAKQRLDQRSYKQVTTGTGDTSSTHRVALAPSLAASGDQLYLAWTGSDAALNLLAAEPSAQAPLTLRERSGHSPSLAASADGDLVLAWTGTDRHVNLLALAQGPEPAPGAPGAAKTTFEQARSADPPALCCYRGNLVLAWTGTDHCVNIAADATAPAGLPVRLDGARTRHAPALCHHQGGLVLAWTGTDHHVNILTGAEQPLGTPVRLDEARTRHAPALCSHQGSLIVAWSGTDNRLNLARLS